MTTTDCDHVLDQLFDEVENGAEPYPIFFSDRSCFGTQFPPTGHLPKLDSTLTPSLEPNWPTWQKIQSFYVPQNIDVTFWTYTRIDLPGEQGQFDINGETLVVNVQGDLNLLRATWAPLAGGSCPADKTLISACSPLKLCFNGAASPTDCCDDCWGCTKQVTCPADCKSQAPCEEGSANLITTGSIGSMRFNRKVSFQELILESCSGRSPLTIMGRTVTKYEPQSQFCDDFMENYCILNPGDELCSCFVDEGVLEEMFPSHSNLSVTCLGPSCQHNTVAYQTKEMSEQNCNKLCKKELCDLRLTLEEDGITHIRCGNEILERPTEDQCKEESALFFLWFVIPAVIAVASLVFVILLATKWKTK